METRRGALVGSAMLCTVEDAVEDAVVRDGMRARVSLELVVAGVHGLEVVVCAWLGRVLAGVKRKVKAGRDGYEATTMNENT